MVADGCHLGECSWQIAGRSLVRVLGRVDDRPLRTAPADDIRIVDDGYLADRVKLFQLVEHVLPVLDFQCTGICLRGAHPLPGAGLPVV